MGKGIDFAGDGMKDVQNRAGTDMPTGKLSGTKVVKFAGTDETGGGVSTKMPKQSVPGGNTIKFAGKK